MKVPTTSFFLCFSHFKYKLQSTSQCIMLTNRNNTWDRYDGCSKKIAHFYLETSNFKLATKCLFHALGVLLVVRNAKFQPMYPLLERVTLRWFRHVNTVLMHGRSKYMSGLVFPPSKE